MLERRRVVEREATVAVLVGADDEPAARVVSRACEVPVGLDHD
jgi:hypothetical protein